MDWPARPYIAPNTLHVCDWLDLMQALPDGSVDMIATDMPYGTTACSWDTVIDLDAWWVECRRVMKPRGAVVCTGSEPFSSILRTSWLEGYRYDWVWEKSYGTNFFMARYQPMKVHENVLVFSEQAASYYPQYEKGKPYRATSGAADRPYLNGSKAANYYNTINSGYREPRSVIEFNNQTGKHPTQKPVALFDYLIRTYTQPGDLVVDPFVGSGTTAVAAKITGRRFICGDQSPEYIDIARKRVFPTFGQPPKRKREEKPLHDLPLFAALEEESPAIAG